MLEHVPAWLGNLLKNVRAGHEKLVVAQPDVESSAAAIDLSSPAFANGGRLPERFTADGAGVSPPLVWGKLPDGTRSLALIVEDPDAPSTQPLVHAIVWGISPDAQRLAEGSIIADGEGGDGCTDVGRNSYFSEGWLPPDPPTGHGSHDYVFQLFALSVTAAIDANPGRSALVEAIRGNILGAGVLVGTYSRGEAAAAEAQTNIAGIAPA
jgi:Raf kinase inhibitor-like YbhB/YbcL family protein